MRSETREHGVAFHGNNAVLVVDRGGWEVYPETDKVDKKVRVFKAPGVLRQSAGTEDYHLLHVQNFIDCMRSRKRPNSDVEIGHNSMVATSGILPSVLGAKSSGMLSKERMVSDPEAQNYVSREYRAPWKLST